MAKNDPRVTKNRLTGLVREIKSGPCFRHPSLRDGSRKHSDRKTDIISRFSSVEYSGKTFQNRNLRKLNFFGKIEKNETGGRFDFFRFLRKFQLFKIRVQYGLFTVIRTLCVPVFAIQKFGSG